MPPVRRPKDGARPGALAASAGESAVGPPPGGAAVRRLCTLAENTLFLLFALVLLWAPLPFGSNRPWGLAILAFGLAALLACWLVLYLFGGAQISRRVMARGALPLLLVSLVPLWVWLQTLPIDADMVAALSPRAHHLHLPASRLPLSLDVAATRLYLLMAVACASGFALVLVLVNGDRRARILLWVLVASGSCQAFYGVMMVLTGLEWGFLVEKYANLGVATGTFVNRNHLAGYLVICLAAGTGLLLSQLSRDRVEGWRDFARQSLAVLLSSKVLIRVLLAVMVIGLVLTRSRMGNVAFFTALAVAGGLAIALARRFSPRLGLLLLSLLVVDAVILGQWFGLDQLVERLEEMAPEGRQRLEVSARSSHVLRDFPLTGSGGGSYYSIFTYYQDPAVPGYYTHAHNDYLEIASDLGIPTLLVLGAFCLLVMRRAIIMMLPRGTGLQRGVGFALVMVMVWLLMHSAVDFNLQIPANALTLCAVLGLAFASLAPRPSAFRATDRAFTVPPKKMEISHTSA